MSKQFKDLEPGDLVYYADTDFPIISVQKVKAIDINSKSLILEIDTTINCSNLMWNDYYYRKGNRILSTDLHTFKRGIANSGLDLPETLNEVYELEFIQSYYDRLKEIKQEYFKNKEEIEQIMKQYESND